MFLDYILGFVKFTIKNIFDFLYFWYIRGSKDFWKKEVNFIKSTEREMGLLINLKLITQPIYGDDSYMGRVLGPFFRFFRVVIGFLILIASLALIVIFYIIWILIIPVALYMIFSNLFYLLL